MSTIRRRMMSYKHDNLEPEIDYLTIIPESEDGCNFIIYNLFIAEFLNERVFPIYASIDDGDWVEYSYDSNIYVPYGSFLKLKARMVDYADEIENSSYFDSSTYRIICSTPYSAQGTPMSLLYGDEYASRKDMLSIDGFGGVLFGLFSGELIRINNPKNFLPATELTRGCYECMFLSCESLTNAPELPATTLAGGCYQYMFRYCTSLQTAPELPATTLVDGCYQYMFDGCTSLQTAPELPATTLATYCYESMFNGCTSLNYIKMLATDISATLCLNNWVNGVSSTGTFVKNAAMNDLPTATSDNNYAGIPSGWTVIDTTFPTNEEGYPESTEFSFPLYLNCTNLDYEDEMAIYYSRPADEISMALYEYLGSLNLGLHEDYTFTTDEKIFFNRMPISVIHYVGSAYDCDYKNIIFTLNYNGEINMDYYK